MRVYVRTLTLFAALLGGTGALTAQQLREDSYRWYVGPQAGVLLFQTQTQDYSTMPTVGFHMLVMGKRGGMMGKHGGMMGQMADTNGDGTITRAEFDAATAAHFAKGDSDKNGTISASIQNPWPLR